MDNFMGYKGRDVEISMLDNDLCLVVACDSCGAIGAKDLDLLKVPSTLVGNMTARAVLLEVMCTGAVPKIMTVAISAELDPTGNEILKGVRKELAKSNFTHLPLAISTEKNFTTRQTGLGISVTGTCNTNDLKISKSRPGNHVYCLGLPKVGEEVLNPDDPEIITAHALGKLLPLPGVNDIVPVGSKGILVEAGQLAENTECNFKINTNTFLDLKKSAGPSTCIIFTSTVQQDKTLFGKLPLSCIGTLI